MDQEIIQKSNDIWAAVLIRIKNAARSKMIFKIKQYYKFYKKNILSKIEIKCRVE